VCVEIDDPTVFALVVMACAEASAPPDKKRKYPIPRARTVTIIMFTGNEIPPPIAICVAIVIDVRLRC
jgi:hypothetical protein